jgi:hypothetical protein
MTSTHRAAPIGRVANLDDLCVPLTFRLFVISFEGPHATPIPEILRFSMNRVDLFFGWLLVLGGLLHAVGSWTGYRQSPELLLWALSGSLAAILVATLNVLRVGRPADRSLAVASFVGSVVWMAIALGFGFVIGNVLDPRVMIHAVNAGVLAIFSVRSLSRAA